MSPRLSGAVSTGMVSASPVVRAKLALARAVRSMMRVKITGRSGGKCAPSATCWSSDSISVSAVAIASMALSSSRSTATRAALARSQHLRGA